VHNYIPVKNIIVQTEFMNIISFLSSLVSAIIIYMGVHNTVDG